MRLRARPMIAACALALAIFLSLACPAPAEDRYELTFCTYLGGAGRENFRDVAVDAQGNIYVTGGTSSADFPTTEGAYDRSFGTGGSGLGSGGPMDVFVTKYSPAGRVLWSTLLGGPNYDRAYAIEVDKHGGVYVAGRAGPGFPTTEGVIQSKFGGHTGDRGRYGKQDGFIAKLAPDGRRLLWATYFGGADGGFIRDIDVDAAGNVFVASAGNLLRDHPGVSGGAFDTTHNGQADLVVAKVSSDGKRLVWGTYLGGSGHDSGGPSVRVCRRTGEVYVVGNTSSSDFPTPNGHDRSYGGGKHYTGDAFLAKFSADGKRLLFATYLGGSGQEGTGTHNLAVTRDGKAIVAHWTKSRDIQILPGGLQRTAGGGGSDCVVWKFSAAGKLLANTYLGGNGGENVQGTIVDESGNVYLSIDSCSSTDFPVTPGAHQKAKAGGADAVYVKLGPRLRRILYSTYLGGSGRDGSRAAALGPDGSYVCAGGTASRDFPLRTACDNSLAGVCDGFVAKFRPKVGAAKP